MLGISPEIAVCETKSHFSNVCRFSLFSLILFVQDLSLLNSYLGHLRRKHLPKQKPNRKPSDYYGETYVETFANAVMFVNISLFEAFAEKETKTAKGVRIFQIQGFNFNFLLNNQPSQAKPSQVNPSQANQSQPKLT